MYRNIAVLYDGSPQARKALAAAIDLVGLDVSPRITLVTKGKQPKFGELSFEEATQMAGVAVVSDAELDETQRKYLERARELVAADIAEEVGEIPPFIRFGIVAPFSYNALSIGRCLEELGADCLVVGRSGPGTLRASLGRVASGAVKEAGIPVLMVQ